MSDDKDVTVGSIEPAPTDDEVAAITAAIELSWPEPDAEQPQGSAPARWRFSGRWWSRPIPARRDRPV